MLALEQVERHRFGQVGVKERLAFGLQSALATFLGRAFMLSTEPQIGQFFFQEGPERHQLILGELHACVVVGDGFLD